METEKPKETKTQPEDIKTSKRAGRYLLVGITITIFNFGFYSILANLIINNNDYLWLSTLISTIAATIVAYLLHSKITWKDRQVTKATICRFFIWNTILAIAIGPWLTQLFSLFTPLYDLAFNISNALHLPFTYEFIQSTGAFVLTSIVVMVLNYLFYDKFVFQKTKSTKETSK